MERLLVYCRCDAQEGLVLLLSWCKSGPCYSVQIVVVRWNAGRGVVLFVLH